MVSTITVNKIAKERELIYPCLYSINTEQHRFSRKKNNEVYNRIAKYSRTISIVLFIFKQGKDTQRGRLTYFTACPDVYNIDDKLINIFQKNFFSFSFLNNDSKT